MGITVTGEVSVPESYRKWPGFPDGKGRAAYLREGRGKYVLVQLPAIKNIID